jgi:hypothetical protein
VPLAVVTTDEAIDQALSENRLSNAYRKEIQLRLHSEDDGWRMCCGNFCDPCAETIGRVVDRTREILAGKASPPRAALPVVDDDDSDSRFR